MQTTAAAYPWAKELEKTVTQSLLTSFGLDFILFKDKKGGNVDTIHNVRQGTWATEAAQQQYEQRGDYDSARYHSHANYIATGRHDKKLQSEGLLHDAYNNQHLGANDERDLDHVISAKEIHDDAGRVLAGLEGSELANQSSNLQSTHSTINRSKKQASVEEYLAKLPTLITTHEQTLAKKREQLANLPRDTPEQQHKARALESDIEKTEKKISKLQSIDPEEMRKKDREARKNYDQEINVTYYTSSKFLKSAAADIGISSLKMGARQMLGLIMAECWFEFREKLPEIINQSKSGFKLKEFIHKVHETLEGIWARVKARFKDFINDFKNGFFSGVLSSATTTIFNIFATTQKQIVKIIREVWSHITKAIKLLFFNPDNLPFTELCQAVVSVISVGVATVIGAGIYTELAVLLSFPLGAELAAFAGALTTGIITLGLNYFLIHSDLAKKVWSFVDTLDPHARTLKDFQAVNQQLDSYLTELSLIEFNMDTDELEAFSSALITNNDELKNSFLLKQEIQKRNIALPFEMGKKDTLIAFLASKAQ